MQPLVFESGAHGEQAYDIYSRHLKEGIIYVRGVIDDGAADAVSAQLLYLDEFKILDKGISLYVNSPGGDPTAVLAIYDSIKFIKKKVSTIVIGQCLGNSLIILAGGTGERIALPNSRMAITDTVGHAVGKASDIQIDAEELIRLKNLTNVILSRNSRLSLEQVDAMSKKTRYLTPTDALEMGLVDEVIKERKTQRG